MPFATKSDPPFSAGITGRARKPHTPQSQRKLDHPRIKTLPPSSAPALPEIPLCREPGGAAHPAWLSPGWPSGDLHDESTALCSGSDPYLLLWPVAGARDYSVRSLSCPNVPTELTRHLTLVCCSPPVCLTLFLVLGPRGFLFSQPPQWAGHVSERTCPLPVSWPSLSFSQGHWRWSDIIGLRIICDVIRCFPRDCN